MSQYNHIPEKPSFSQDLINKYATNAHDTQHKTASPAMSTKKEPSAVPVPYEPPDRNQSSDVKQPLDVNGSELPEASPDMPTKNDPSAVPVPDVPLDGSQRSDVKQPLDVKSS